MKNQIFLLSVFLCLFLSIPLSAQVDSAYVGSTHVDIVEAAADAATAAAVAYAGESYNENGDFKMPDNELKKYTFKKGTPTILIVNIQQSYPNDSLLAIREFEELKKNYSGKPFTIQLISEKSILDFPNSSKSEIRYDEYNSEYKELIYWSGNPRDEVEIFDTYIQASESLIPFTLVEKESSYVPNYIAEKDKLMHFSDKISAQSINISNRYILNMLLDEIYFLKNKENFFHFDFKGIKKLTVNSNHKDYKNPIHIVDFDKEGFPTRILYSSDNSDQQKMIITFSYTQGVLTKMFVKEEKGDWTNEETFQYNNGFMNSNREDLYLTKYYVDKNGFLLHDAYFFYDEKFQIQEDHLSMKGNTLQYRDYGDLNNHEFTLNNLKDYFPIKGNYRSGESFITLSKPNQNTVLIKGDFDTYDIQLDQNNRILSILYQNKEMDNSEQQTPIKIDYLYEYY